MALPFLWRAASQGGNRGPWLRYVLGHVTTEFYHGLQVLSMTGVEACAQTRVQRMRWRYPVVSPAPQDGPAPSHGRPSPLRPIGASLGRSSAALLHPPAPRFLCRLRGGEGGVLCLWRGRGGVPRWAMPSPRDPRRLSALEWGKGEGRLGRSMAGGHRGSRTERPKSRSGATRAAGAARMRVWAVTSRESGARVWPFRGYGKPAPYSAPRMVLDLGGAVRSAYYM